MKLTHLATGRLVQSRMGAVSGDRQAFLTVTGIMGSLAPLSAEKAALYGGVMGKTYVIHIDAELDAREGDRFRDEAGTFYVVVKGGVSRRTYGAFDFDRIIVQQTA